MKEANQCIFKRLSERSSTPDSQIRWIKTDKHEKKWLQDLNITEEKWILPSLTTALSVFDKQKYLVVIGFDTVINNDDLIEPVDLNAGLVTAVLSELEIPFANFVTSEQIIEDILWQYRKMPSTEGTYEGHDFTEIARFFQPIQVYKILYESAIIAAQLERLSCVYFCQVIQSPPFLSFSSEVIDLYYQLATTGPSSIPYENLLLSLSSGNWKYAFLELYKCLENLFSISNPQLRGLHTTLTDNNKLEIPLRDFSGKIENIIDWYPREIQAIQSLINQTSKSVKDALKQVGNFNLNDEASDETLAKKFYRLRNSITHYRAGIKPVQLDAQNGNCLIKATLMLIEELYQKYDCELS